MSAGAKESTGFKLLVVLGIGGLLAGGAVLKQKLSGDAPKPVATTTAQSADVSAHVPTTASTAPIASAAPEAGTPAPSNVDRAALAEAAAAGDLARVQALHAKGLSLEGTLAPAARSGNVTLLTWLVDNGVDVHEDEDAKVPPLVEAEDHDGVVALLLARGVKEPSLVQAVSAQAPKTVARLLGKKADPNAKPEGAWASALATNESLLHYAVHSGVGPKRTAIVKSLLDAGAKPEVGLDEDTPLHEAVDEAERGSDGAVDVVKLIAGKATVDRDALDAAVSMRGDKKEAVLDALLAGKVAPAAAFRAVAHTTDPKLVARLATKNIAWGTKDPMVEEPPLLVAARKIDVELVKALLAAGAPAETGDELGDTPLLATIEASPPDSEDAAKVVNALLAKGANPNKRARDGRRPLHLAAERGEESIVKALLAKGAHVDDEVNGTSPLEAAEANGHQAVAALLKAKGAKKKVAP